MVNVSEQRSPEFDVGHNSPHKSEVKIDKDHKQERFYLVDPSGSVGGNDLPVLLQTDPNSLRGILSRERRSSR